MADETNAGKPDVSRYLPLVIGVVLLVGLVVLVGFVDIATLKARYALYAWLLFAGTILSVCGFNRVKSDGKAAGAWQPGMNFSATIVGVTLVLFALTVNP